MLQKFFSDKETHFWPYAFSFNMRQTETHRVIESLNLDNSRKYILVYHQNDISNTKLQILRKTFELLIQSSRNLGILLVGEKMIRDFWPLIREQHLANYIFYPYDPKTFQSLITASDLVINPDEGEVRNNILLNIAIYNKKLLTSQKTDLLSDYNIAKHQVIFLAKQDFRVKSLYSLVTNYIGNSATNQPEIMHTVSLDRKLSTETRLKELLDSI
jgi:hypothetical protein